MEPPVHPPSPREEELFFRALELPEHARAEFIRESCAEDAALRSAVEALLADHGEATTFFTEAAGQIAVPDAEASGVDLEPGAQVGPYRIVRPLGEGGGGRVYEAAQEAPVRRKVALKILKLGMDTRQVITRFEAERQTLALMEHPNIARVLDAGATATGRPYFVMELVHGTKITDYCARHHVASEVRLRLLCDVCAAVQHAHQKGVIHRDLKPSNILVSEIDGTPVPKVIDFGIAKATSAAGGEDGERTMHHQVAGTPAYMSPEQFQGAALDVDTRSDIYSLGAVLYELVAGRPAFESSDLLRGGFEEMRRRIQHEEPARPSAHLDHGRRELDWIVLKAMEKDRERRYPSARALAADIESYLAHEPVEAHPASHWYRLQKLVRRNRLASAAITIAVVALLGGFTTSTLLYFRARAAEMQQARLRAEAEEREHVARAAILLMQGRTAEADAEVRLMGGVLTQPSVEASNVFRSLGIWSAMQGDWETSAARWLALSRVNRFDDRDMTDNASRDLLPVAPALLEAGDEAAYHDFRRVLIDRLGHTNNPTAAEQVLKLCLHQPAPPEVLAALAPMAGVAERSLPADPAIAPANWLQAWRSAALALWHYRSGQHAQAIQWCDRVLLYRDDDESRHAMARTIRAMATLASDGDPARAAGDLARAREAVAQHTGEHLSFNAGGYWHDWVSTRVLLREADGR